jgi:hypothetical protein
MYTVSYGNAYAKLVQTDRKLVQTDPELVKTVRQQFNDNTEALGLTPPDKIPDVNFTFLGRKGTQWLRTLDGVKGFTGYSDDEWTSDEKAKAVE